jgi:hypothetical protein
MHDDGGLVWSYLAGIATCLFFRFGRGRRRGRSGKSRNPYPERKRRARRID